MAGPVVAEHYFEFNSVKYFRDQAENIELCSFGEKVDPIGSLSRLQVDGTVMRIILKDYKIEKMKSTYIEWERFTKADVEVNGELPAFGLDWSGTSGKSYEDAKRAKLRLIKFYINRDPLKTMLNKDAAKARNTIKDEGNDGRIVSTIWVVLMADLAGHFDASASDSMSVKAGGGGELDVTVNVGASGSYTMSLSPGTTFAYGYHKVTKWDKDIIEEMEDDYYNKII